MVREKERRREENGDEGEKEKGEERVHGEGMVMKRVK